MAKLKQTAIGAPDKLEWPFGYRFANAGKYAGQFLFAEVQNGD